MNEIKTVHFNYLRNEAHYEFLLVVDKLFIANKAAATVVEDLLPGFRSLIALEGELVDAEKASVYTKELAEADNRRDRDMVGINSAINAALHHPDPNKVKAAEALELLLKAFRGSIEQKSYAEETAAVKILVADLQGKYSTQVAQTGIGDWVSDLAAANAEFDQLYLARNTEMANRPQGRIPDVRKQVESSYRGITTRIDAFMVINGAKPESKEVKQFIMELNQAVSYANEHTHRRAKHDIGTGDDCVVEPIPTQPYTGKAVTPIPKAHYRQQGKPTVELTFAKDFSVTYKNNIEVGTADLTLHGKGEYKGKKTVTFTIEN